MIGETMMIHNPGDSYIAIDAGDPAMIESIMQLKEQYPDKVRIAQKYSDGSIRACVPFEWVKISAE